MRTFNCGCGPRDEGGGIDVASGSFGTVVSFIDVGSANGYILDLGAGASCTGSDLVVF